MEKSKRRRSYARAYYRLSVLCLAAMVTARLILLMIDVIQLQIQTAGAFSIPASAAILVFTGWELKTWTGQGKEKKSCGPTSVTAAERRLTPESGATARTARPSTTASRSSPRRTSTTPRPRYLIAYAWHPASNAWELVEYGRRRKGQNHLQVTILKR